MAFITATCCRIIECKAKESLAVARDVYRWCCRLSAWVTSRYLERTTNNLGVDGQQLVCGYKSKQAGTLCTFQWNACSTHKTQISQYIQRSRVSPNNIK